MGARPDGRHVLVAAQPVAGGAARKMREGIETLRRVPGLGVVVLLVVLWLTGLFVANIFGQWWLQQWDRLLHKIPIVKSIYSSVKQVSDTLFSSSGNAFREAVLVQYPAHRLVDDRVRHRSAERRGSASPGVAARQRVRADDAEPDLGFLFDDAARRGGAAGDECRRGAQVHHLDGRGGAAPAGAPARRRSAARN